MFDRPVSGNGTCRRFPSPASSRTGIVARLDSNFEAEFVAAPGGTKFR